MIETRLSPSSSSSKRYFRDNGQVEVGIVNNMSGNGFHSITRQFSSLLEDAGVGPLVRLRIFSPFVNPKYLASGRLAAVGYEPIENLWHSGLDGLIVTGTEPMASRLVEEPCWPFLSRLVDWADENISSAIWSCLATQAAVFSMDGIERQSVGRKISGLYACAKSGDHRIFDGCPDKWATPHSRYNDLPEAVLSAKGYTILARAHSVGADTFVKRQKALHVFLQGHMEYGFDVLSREYRRDVRRFLNRSSDVYPDVPAHYLPQDVVDALIVFRDLALKNRNPEIFFNLPLRLSASAPEPPWRPVAAQFYRNWLTYLASVKGADLGLSSLPTSSHRPSRPDTSTPRRA